MPERELEKKEHQVFISYCNENPGNNVGDQKEKGKDKQKFWLKWGLVTASVIVLVVFFIIILQTQQDGLAFKTAENKNTIPAYHEYLEIFPSGKYVNEAKDRIIKFEKIHEDVRKVASKASKGIKVEKKANGFWEADYGEKRGARQNIKNIKKKFELFFFFGLLIMTPFFSFIKLRIIRLMTPTSQALPRITLLPP